MNKFFETRELFVFISNSLSVPMKIKSRNLLYQNHYMTICGSQGYQQFLAYNCNQQKTRYTSAFSLGLITNLRLLQQGVLHHCLQYPQPPKSVKIHFRSKSIQQESSKPPCSPKKIVNKHRSYICKKKKKEHKKIPVYSS